MALTLVFASPVRFGLASPLGLRRQVGADASALELYCSRVIGWVSDFGTESDLPSVPNFDLETFLNQGKADAGGLLVYHDAEADDRLTSGIVKGHPKAPKCVHPAHVVFRPTGQRTASKP